MTEFPDDADGSVLADLAKHGVDLGDRQENLYPNQTEWNHKEKEEKTKPV